MSSQLSKLNDPKPNSYAAKHKHQRAQNYLLLWVDSNIDMTEKDCQHTLEQLHLVVNEINICRTVKKCSELLDDVGDEKAFIICSGTLGQTLVRTFHDNLYVDTIYVFCHNEATHKAWAAEWPKIQGVFTNIEPICESLKTVARECDHNAMPMSFVTKQMITSATSTRQNFNQLQPSFMYSVLFKEILLEIVEDDKQAVKDLVTYCKRKRCSGAELKYFEHEYEQRLPIWWYTCEIFLYSMLNKALRSLDTEAMLKMGFFIRSLHRQLEKLHKKQLSTYKETFIVYRGQGVSKQDLQSLMDTQGGLLSFNNFLSTTRKKDIAMRFINRVLSKYEDQMALLFIMTIDPSKQSAMTTPFALLDTYSCEPQEQEILFTMHTVFRVTEIIQTISKNRQWEVHLSLTDENDLQLISLTQLMREEISGNGWYRMGQLMLKMGQFDHAENVFKELLNKSITDNDKINLYDMLGILKNHQGKYQEAISYSTKSLEIKRRNFANDDLTLLSTYNNLGLAYKNIHNPMEALYYYKKAHQIYTRLPLNHPDLAVFYNNIAVIHSEMGNYTLALECHQKCLTFIDVDLRSYHPDLAISYTNIGRVHDYMGDYTKALEYYKKALEIDEKSLTKDHLYIATSYNNISQEYSKIGDYAKGREYCEKAQSIYEKSFSPNHPDLAETQLTFAMCYERMGDYKVALKALEKALEIQKKTFQKDNPVFALTFSRLGGIFLTLEDHAKALDYLEKCRAIRQQGLPEKHPYMGTTYSDIGYAHFLQGNHEKALSFFEEALNIQEMVECNPLDRATTYARIGETYGKMKTYANAFAHTEMALQIYKERLSNNHPDLILLYCKLGELHFITENYREAMSYIEQAVKIAEEKMPKQHPYYSRCKKQYDKVRRKM